MRIALVSSSIAPWRLGGSEIYAAMLAKALVEQHEVVLYTGARDGLPGVETIRLPALPELPRGAPGLRKTVWHARDQWLRSVHEELKRELRRFRPNVVHTHHPQGLSGAVFTAISAVDARHAHTVHDANVLCARITMMRGDGFCGGRCLSCRPQRLIRGKLLGRSLDRLIAPSDYFREMHVRAGIVPAAQAQTIRQGAEPGSARVRGEGEVFTIGYLGALAPHKGVPTLLDAFRSAPPDWALRVAGSGPLEDAVRDAARTDARIAATGVVSGVGLDEFLDRVEVLAIPSEYEENAPLTAVEAAVRGLPAVVSDRGGLPETPEGTVFRAGDGGALLAALKRLAAERELLMAKSRRLLETRERFLWRTHVSRVEQALGEVAE
jgi:glycosyltransferase involved in cell wall biosynthesis